MAQRNANVLAKTAVLWIKKQMVGTGGALQWVRFARIVKAMHILAGWPDQAHTKMHKLLRAVARDGLLEEQIGVSPSSYRVAGKFYAMSDAELEKYIIDKHVPSISPWGDVQGTHFKDSRQTKVDVPAWMNHDVFHKQIVEEVKLPVIERPRKKKNGESEQPDIPTEITITPDIERRIGFVGNPSSVPTGTTAGFEINPSSSVPLLPTPPTGKRSAMNNSMPIDKEEVQGIVHAAMLEEFANEGKLIERRLIEKLEKMASAVEDKIVAQIGRSGKLPIVHRIEFNDEALLRMKTKGHAILKKAVQTIEAGCCVVLSGPYACGRSTAAKHTAKLLKCVNIHITSMPENITAALSNNENTLVCFQNIHLWNEASVLWCRKLVDDNPKVKFMATILVKQEVPEAIRDLFTARLEMDYDKDIESQICPDIAILERCWKCRDAAKQRRFAPIFHTRTIQETYKLITAGSWSFEEVLNMVISDYTDAEKRIMLENSK